MKKIIIVLITVTLIAAIVLISANKNDSKPIQTVGYGFKRETSISFSSGDIKKFALLDHHGVFQEIYNIKNKTLLFISHNNACDYLLDGKSNYLKNFKQYKNLHVFYINNDLRLHRESYDKIKESTILLDESQIVTNSLKFSGTGDYVLLNSDNWKIIESGNISKFKNLTNFKSCKLELRKPNKISYVQDVTPILINKCLNCHSKENKILPTLDSYKKIKNWQQMILETLYMDRMPPTSHDNYYGNYHNSDELTADEKLLLTSWLENPISDIDQKDPISTFNKKTVKKRKHFDEIYHVKMDKPHLIPPGGEIIYQYFQLGGPTPFDMWIKLAKANSSNPRQLHHEGLMFTSKPLKYYATEAEKKFPRDKKEIELNMDGTNFPYILRALETYEKNNNDNYFRLNVFGAGKKTEGGFPKGTFGFLPKGSYLILETHYMGTGKDDSEQTEITLLGLKEKPAKFKKLHTSKVASIELNIPANVANFEVVTRPWTAKDNISIIMFSGHLHMRGKSVKMIKISSNNKAQTILSLPKYYYGWHTGVPLRPNEPISVKKGEKLQVICTFDNSSANPFNPDPNKEIHFGHRVDRAEMCKVNFSYTVDQPLDIETE